MPETVTFAPGTCRPLAEVLSDFLRRRGKRGVPTTGRAEDTSRSAVRQLRSLLVEIYPPRLRVVACGVVLAAPATGVNGAVVGRPVPDLASRVVGAVAAPDVTRRVVGAVLGHGDSGRNGTHACRREDE